MRKKTTVYIDEDLLRAARVHAARTDRRDSDVLEDALRRYLGLDLLDKIWASADMSEDESLAIAYEELRAARRKRPPK